MVRHLDIHLQVTAQIIQAIEQGAASFEMPWHCGTEVGVPRNAVTKKTYRGINTVSLWASGFIHGYASPVWASYQQWRSIGAYVRKGEGGSLVVFYKKLAGDLQEDAIPKAVIRHSHVFNSEQVDGWNGCAESGAGESEKNGNVDNFVRGLGSDVRYGTSYASYSPALDRVFMPHRHHFQESFKGTAIEAFYSTLLHEHVHWSGHSSRLNRDLSGRFGSHSYAMEELIAELGAAFLCATQRISVCPRQDHAAYIGDWLKVLAEKKTAIFIAAHLASTAADYLESISAVSEGIPAT